LPIPLDSEAFGLRTNYFFNICIISSSYFSTVYIHKNLLKTSKQTDKTEHFGLLAKMLLEMAAYQLPVGNIHGQLLSSNHAWELHWSMQDGID